MPAPCSVQTAPGLPSVPNVWDVRGNLFSLALSSSESLGPLRTPGIDGQSQETLEARAHSLVVGWGCHWPQWLVPNQIIMTPEAIPLPYLTSDPVLHLRHHLSTKAGLVLHVQIPLDFYFFILKCLLWSRCFSMKVASLKIAIVFLSSTRTAFWTMGPVLHLLWLLMRPEFWGPPSVLWRAEVPHLPYHTWPWTEGRRPLA